MFEGEFAMLRGMYYLTLHVGLYVDDGRPVGDVLAEESQYVVWIQGMHEATHEIVAARDVYAFLGGWFADVLIEVLVQLRGDYLIGINHKHPGVGG